MEHLVLRWATLVVEATDEELYDNHRKDKIISLVRY
jgi:hypothetical protein